MQTQNTRRRVYAWLLAMALALFPLVWTWQASFASPYATALTFDETGTAQIPAVHPAPPSRLERFGTDGLGRDIAGLVAHAVFPTALLCAEAAASRTVFGMLVGRKRRPPAWLRFRLPVTVFDFGAAALWTALLPLRSGSAVVASAILGIAMGLFFLPAWITLSDLPEGTHPARAAVILFSSQFLRVFGIVLALGLFGMTLGANPYEVLPARGNPTGFTHPHFMNLVSAATVRSLPWWIGGIPLLFGGGILAAGTGAILSWHRRLRQSGTLLSPAQYAVVSFFSPRQLVREIREAAQHAGRLSLRVLFVILAIWFVFLSRERKAPPLSMSSSASSYEQTLAQTTSLSTADDRLAYAEARLREWKLNPLQEDFRIPLPGHPNEFAAAGGLLGGSRTQPLLFLMDVSGTEEEFAANVSLARGLVETVRGKSPQQSILFLFTAGRAEGTDLRALLTSPMLHSPDRIFFVSISAPPGERIVLDETLLLPSGGWSARVAGCFRDALKRQGFPLTMGFLGTSPIVRDAAASGMAGLQLGGNVPDKKASDWQRLVDAMIDAGARFAQLRTP